jgi:hypothetical protein
MRIAVKRIGPVLAAGAAGLAISTAVAAFSSAPMAAGQPSEPTPAPVTVTTTILTAAPTPGPQDGMSCTSSSTSTKCQKHGDAEINAAIPAPYPGVYGVYGPFWGGSAG